MSTIKTTNIQNPDADEPNFQLNPDGSVNAKSFKHPESSESQITMNADGTINASGLNVSNLSINDQDIQNTISQSHLSLEKELVPDENDEYTIQEEDVGKVLTLDDEDAEKIVTVNIPEDSQTDFEIGSTIKFYRENEANIAIKPDESVSIRSPLAPGPYYFTRKYGEPQIRKRAQNQWALTESGLLIQSLFATGGDQVFDEIIEGAVYRIHKFTIIGSSQAFEVEIGGGQVEYVVVAGGGGTNSAAGGGGGSGGGGAGGYRSSVQGEASGGGTLAEPTLNIEVGAYPVVVGAGGIGANHQDGEIGEDSSFDNIVSKGGGAGSQAGSLVDGGSGAGRGVGSNSPTWGDGPGSGIAGQGHDGATGSTSNSGTGGGGGGAGEAGKVGHGGDGVSTNITGTPTYLAGGGASQAVNATAFNGGLGGGGDSRQHGEPNTGGGAGGYAPNNAPFNGGSGIVIIRYRIG